MLRTAIVLATTLFVFCPTSGWAQEEWRVSDAGKLFNELTKDFGKLPLRADVQHRFEMKNSFEFPVHILHILPNSSHVKCVPTTKRLRPGQIEYLNVVWKRSEFVGDTRVGVWIKVQFEDRTSKVSETSLTMKAGDVSESEELRANR